MRELLVSRSSTVQCHDVGLSQHLPTVSPFHPLATGPPIRNYDQDEDSVRKDTGLQIRGERSSSPGRIEVEADIESLQGASRYL